MVTTAHRSDFELSHLDEVHKNPFRIQTQPAHVEPMGYSGSDWRRYPRQEAVKHVAQPANAFQSMPTSLGEKAQLLEREKAETAMLMGQIRSAREQSRDTSLPAMAEQTPDLPPLSIKPENRIFRGHISKVICLRMASDDRTLITVGRDGILLAWDAQSTRKLDVVILTNPWMLTCAVAPDASYVAAGGLDNTCTVYKLGYDGGGLKTPNVVLKGHRAYISDMQFVSPNSILTSSGDMTLGLWDMSVGRRIADYKGHLGDVTGLALHPKDSRIVATTSSDSTIRIWDLRCAQSSQKFSLRGPDTTCAQFFPNGQAVACGLDEGSCCVFDLRADCKLASYRRFEKNFLNPSVTCLTFSNSGRLLLAAHDDGSCGAWDTLKASRVVDIETRTGPISSLVVNSRGDRIFASSWDSTVSS